MDEHDKLKIIDYVFDYLKGALFWGAERFVLDRFEDWSPVRHGKERKCHPLLSLRESRFESMCDMIPMLAGTSMKRENDKKNGVVVLMNDSVPNVKTVFGTSVESHLVFADDLLFHSEERNIEQNPETPLWYRRRLWPNLIKPRITDKEDTLLKAFLDRREKAANKNGGYNT